MAASLDCALASAASTIDCSGERPIPTSCEAESQAVIACFGGTTTPPTDTTTVTDTTSSTDTTLPPDVTLVTPDQTTPPQDNTIPPPPVSTQAACQDFAVCVTNCTTVECQNNCMAINPNGSTSYLGYDTCVSNACGPVPADTDPTFATWAACKGVADRVGGACSPEYQACFTGQSNCISIFTCFGTCAQTDNLCLSKCVWAASYTAQEKFNQFTDCALGSCPDACSTTNLGSGAACTDLSTCQPFEACDPTTGTCLFTETSCSTCAQQSCPTQLSACQQDTGIGFFRAPNFSQPEMNPEYKDLPPLEFPLSVVPLLKLHNPF
jgi:hypothetical protein